VQEPPLAVALCISEVLNIPDVHSLAESIQSRPESRPDSDVLPRLAVKAKSLLDDNARMQSELQSLQEERVDLESQLQSVQAAMANMVRVAEIMNMRSRFTPSSANPTQNILLAGRGSFCAGCGTACAKCSDTSPPPTRTRWSMQMKDAVPKHDDGRNRLRILPPPRRVSRASSSEAMNSPALVPPDSPSIHLGEADCGVSLNRFRQSDDDENTDDEAGVGEQVAEDVNVNQKRVSIADSSEPTCNDKSSDTTVMVCECHSSTTTVADHDVDSPPMVDTDDTDATTVDEESTDDAHRVKPQPDGYPWW
jgi:hypothetical protein